MIFRPDFTQRRATLRRPLPVGAVLCDSLDLGRTIQVVVTTKVRVAYCGERNLRNYQQSRTGAASIRQPCPAPLAAIQHRCYIGKAKDFKRRWRADHLPYLLNGRHACTFLLDALRIGCAQTHLASNSSHGPRGTSSPEWLVRRSGGSYPEWNPGPFLFRVLEEVPLETLTDREGAYHAANPGGYHGSTNDGRRCRKWDGK